MAYLWKASLIFRKFTGHSVTCCKNPLENLVGKFPLFTSAKDRQFAQSAVGKNDSYKLMLQVKYQSLTQARFVCSYSKVSWEIHMNY
jgi:hypothetical protein